MSFFSWLHTKKKKKKRKKKKERKIENVNCGYGLLGVFQ